MSLTLEAEISPGIRAQEVKALAMTIENAGFDRLGISDVALYQDCFQIQALCAEDTNRHMFEYGQRLQL